MQLEEIKEVLQFDGEISYGDGTVTVVLDKELHTKLMKMTNGSKWKRADKIRAIMDIYFDLRLGNINIGGGQSTVESPKQKMRLLKRKKKLSKVEKRDLEVYNLKGSLMDELKERFASLHNRTEEIQEEIVHATAAIEMRKAQLSVLDAPNPPK